MMAFAVIYSVTSWKLFEYILNFLGLLKKEWIINEITLELNENAP